VPTQYPYILSEDPCIGVVFQITMIKFIDERLQEFEGLYLCTYTNTEDWILS